MKPVKVSPMAGALAFLTSTMQGYKQITTPLPNIVVDTCLPSDTFIWETGVERANIEGKWVIVEQYENEEHAKAGHEKWVKMLTQFPDLPIRDIDMWSLEENNDEKTD